jgi:hypothetical protein
LWLGVGVGVAAADPPSPRDTAGNGNEILGVVPTVAAAHAQAARSSGGGNLVYHGGPVLLANRTVAIYWGPGAGAPGSSGLFPDAGYETLINRYLTDVAAASGAQSNVYAVETQYYDSSGSHIRYASTATAPLVDDSSYPANGCADTVAATSVCLSDSQIQAEVAKMVPSPDPRTVYFVFTGKGVGSCYSSSSCAFSSYCAYHGSFTTGAGTYLYANQPYADTVPSACDAGYHPNASVSKDGDATINVASHEHRESINDPLGTAWYDRRGYEGSDKCAWNFGSLQGNSNQTINGNHYILQQEWSNTISGCALGL